MDRYVVIGDPVAHSLSPQIHARFARDTGEVLAYERLHAPRGRFVECAEAFFADAAARGANVTLPFKEEAFAFAACASDRARLAGAANFLAREGDAIVADNTDGAGLLRDLVANQRCDLGGRRILLVGAGGAARGVVAPLLQANPGRLGIANRTHARAEALAQRFAGHGPVVAVPMHALGQEPWDLVINATSTSTHGQPLALPDGLLRAGVLAYDMAYGEAARGFLVAARAAGAQACDGLGMLVEQAAESFLLWRGVRPPTAALLAELRARFA